MTKNDLKLFRHTDAWREITEEFGEDSLADNLVYVIYEIRRLKRLLELRPVKSIEEEAK